MSWPAGAPNPGSDAALEKGCTCPVLDNNHGKWPPWPPNGWWQAPGCPVHRSESEERQEPPAPDPATAGAPAVSRGGLVVVERRLRRVPGRKRAGKGWTLHRHDCRHVGRAGQVLPAPTRPYPDTVPCVYCRPDGDTQEPRARTTKTVAGNQRKRHLYRYVVRDDVDAAEAVRAECMMCDVVACGPTKNAAKTKGYRRHKAAAKRATAGKG